MTPLALCSAALKSRGAYETVKLGGDVEVLPEELIAVWKGIERFYETDKDATQADPDVVKAYASDGLSNPKHTEHISRQVDRLVEAKVSAANIGEMLRLVQRNKVSDSLAHALAARQGEDVVEPLIEEYKRLSTPLDDEAEELDWKAVVKRRLDTTARMKVLPKALNEFLGGGLMPGQNVTLFARPEAGKTALALTMAVGFAQQGHKTLYVINEDSVQDLAVRALCSTIQRTTEEVRADMDTAITEGLKKGLGNLVLRELSPGSIRELEALVKRHQPRVLIVDQIRNLRISKTDNYTQGLDHNAQGLRALGKRYSMVTIGITQAGDSASNRPILEMGDIDSSNTGIPGAADVLIGLGVTDQLRQAGQRVISVSKNKVSGKHGYFTVNINETTSRVKSNG
jgi:replicative DNA helicase